MRQTIVIVAFAHCFTSSLSAQPPEPRSATHFEDSIRPTLVRYCAACHEENDSEGALNFLTAKTDTDLAHAREGWKSVAEQLRNRTMPPADEDQPSETERLQISAWIEETLRATACSGEEYAGSVTSRRLNRNEYENTIRDLLGIDQDLAQKFPVDGSGGEGFDNNGETLFLPPLLMERYLEAATDALNAVIILPRQDIQLSTADFARSDSEHAVLSEEEQATAVVRVLHDATFDANLRFTLEQPGDIHIDVAVDGIKAATFKLSEDDLQVHRADSGANDYRVKTRLRLARGFHEISLTSTGSDPIRIQSLAFTQQADSISEHQKVLHRQLVGINPGDQITEPRRLARAAIQRLATRAFRRPVTDEEIEPFLKLFDRGIDRQDPYEYALHQAMRGILISPHFLFRIEEAPHSDKPEPISDHELATRLSYFLWSSMPDERLFRLARDGRLHESEVLAEEVDRMLKDEKSEAFFYEFTGQWLGTIEVAASIVPDTGKFKGQFTTELLMDFRDEPVRLFQYITQEDRSLLELLDPGYAVVTQRLSSHYQLNGEPPPKKSNANPWSNRPQRSNAATFERIDLKDDRRGGVLGMGGVHLLTSYPNRTSPVMRGGWVLETLLGVRVPAPPPDVPELKTSRNKRELTARESLALHRDNSACAACHNLMDPVGFALENYDVLGRWRDQFEKEDIDASAVLPSGEQFSGLDGLRGVLMDRRDDFIAHLTEKMLGYAIGRSLSDQDDCTVQTIAGKVIEQDYSARSLIREIVLSTPFRKHQRVSH